VTHWRVETPFRSTTETAHTSRWTFPNLLGRLDSQTLAEKTDCLLHGVVASGISLVSLAEQDGNDFVRPEKHNNREVVSLSIWVRLT
jgi:hypothetical protein